MVMVPVDLDRVNYSAAFFSLMEQFCFSSGQGRESGKAKFQGQSSYQSVSQSVSQSVGIFICQAAGPCKGGTIEFPITMNVLHDTSLERFL